MPTQPQTPQTATKAQYDALIADLKAQTHTSPDKQRHVLTWDEYDVPATASRPVRVPEAEGRAAYMSTEPHPHAGKHVVTVQYGGPTGGDGGLLCDFAFNPDDLKAEEKAEEPRVAVPDGPRTAGPVDISPFSSDTGEEFKSPSVDKSNKAPAKEKA
jgi:hypothetical protein